MKIFAITVMLLSSAHSAELPNLTAQTQADKELVEWLKDFWLELPENHPMVSACGKDNSAQGWSSCVYLSPMSLEMTRQISPVEAQELRNRIGDRPSL